MPCQKVANEELQCKGGAFQRRTGIEAYGGNDFSKGKNYALETFLWSIR